MHLNVGPLDHGMTGRGEPESANAGNGLPPFVDFLDSALVRWRVTERDAREDPGARAERCLVFSCDEATRRVWDYPATWRELSPEALSALSWQR